MRILLFSPLDPNQQAQMLCNYINRNTSHKALNVVTNQTYLSYEADVIDPDFNIWEHAKEFDFFIFRWVDSSLIYQMVQHGYVTPFNSIVKFHGSEARYSPYVWQGLWNDLRLTYVTNGYDYTLSRGLGYSVQHIPPMIDCKKLWEGQRKAKLHDDGKFWIAHAPTDPQKKGTKYLIEAMRYPELRGDAAIDVISSSTWQEALARKARCHALFDQISDDVGIGAFGVNLLEGLATSKICFGGYNKFVYSYYPQLAPDFQIVHGATDSLSLVKAIRRAMENKKAWKGEKAFLREFNPAGRAFVERRFDISIVGRQWVNLIEFVSEMGESQNG